MRYDGGPPWEDEYRDCYRDLHILKKIAVLLDQILDDKYRSGLPTIAKDVKKLELKLNYMLDRKSRYGLYKVKHEIKQEIIRCAQNMKDFVDKIDKIEDVVKHSAMVISEIKKDVCRIEEVVTDPKFEDTVKHSALLLNEIKKDVRKIEEIVVDPKFDDTVKHSALLLNEIKKDVEKVEKIVVDPKFEDTVKHSALLLNEIKKDVEKVEKIVADPKFEDTVKHSALLLNEIKKAVGKIEEIVAGSKFEDIVKHSSMVVRDIKKEIGEIEDFITDPYYGLKGIREQLGHRSANTLTTGPLFVDFNGLAVTVVHVKAQNYSNHPQTVTFTIHNLDDNCPFTTGERVVSLVDIPPLCAQFADIPLKQLVRNLEIKAVLSDAANVFVYAAVLDVSNPAGSFVKKDVLHSEWTPIQKIKSHCDENKAIQPTPLE